MPTKKARLQVILRDEATEQVKALAEERGLSVSAMASQLIHAALQLKEYQKAPDLKKAKSAFVSAAIEGGDITSPKALKLLQLLSDLSEAE